MSIAKYILGALLLSALLALPVSSALTQSKERLEQEQKQSKELRLQVDSLKVEQEQEGIEFNQLLEQNENLNRQKEELEKQLQSRREEQTHLAQAKQQRETIKAPAVSISNGNCESYRPLVQKYFGNATEAAMITMAKESGCRSNLVSVTNDYGLFQLHNMPIYDPEENIKTAYQVKFLKPRRGTTPNFSAWYAVCTSDLKPKYSGIWCT